MTLTYVEPATTEERRQYRESSKQLADVPDRMLACRDGGHSFTIPLSVDRRTRGYERTKRCKNGCGCVQAQTLNTMGQILKSHINYPKGYLLKGVGHGRYTKGAARVEAIERILSKQALSA